MNKIKRSRKEISISNKPDLILLDDASSESESESQSNSNFKIYIYFIHFIIEKNSL